MTTRIMLTFNVDDDLGTIIPDSFKMVEDAIDEQGEVTEAKVYIPSNMEVYADLDAPLIHFKAEACEEFGEECFSWDWTSEFDEEVIESLSNALRTNREFSKKVMALAKEEGIEEELIGEEDAEEEAM